MNIKCWLTITIFVLFIGCNADNQSTSISNSPTNAGAISSVDNLKNLSKTNGASLPQTSDPYQCEANGNAIYSFKGDEDPAQIWLPVDIWLSCPENLTQIRTEETSSIANESAKVVLPLEARMVLENYWHYLFSIKEETSLSEIVFTRNDNMQALTKISIDDPNGKRPITLKEAEALLKFLEKARKDGKQRKTIS